MEKTLKKLAEECFREIEVENIEIAQDCSWVLSPGKRSLNRWQNV